MNRTILIGVVAFVLSLPSMSAFAYKTIKVTGGAKLTGTIKLKGQPPAPARVSFPAKLNGADKSFCSGHRPLAVAKYAIDSARRLKNVVVWVEGVSTGKKRTKKPGSLVNENCRFSPHVQSIDAGAKIVIENRDPIMHNTHPSYVSDNRTAFNIAMPKQGAKLRKKVRRAGVLVTKCDSGHVWMKAWIHAFKHPYHMTTGSNGKFVIDELPAGSYVLKVWHEAAGVVSRKFTVTPSQTLRLDFELQAK